MNEQDVISELREIVKATTTDNVFVPVELLSEFVADHNKILKRLNYSLRGFTKLLMHCEHIVKEHISDEELDIICGREKE